ncbi:MAG: PssD/Cps14F family polysaccharide biosynthesis glycosyltransferase [Shewanella sp.]
MNHRYILLINGTGGHRYEMQRLLSHIKSKLVAKGISAVHFGECIVDDLIVDSYPVSDIRHKSSKAKTIFMALSSFTHCLINSFKIGRAYNISTVLSTGPGLCILPSILMKYFFGSKVIYIETGCMFYHRTLTGMFMKRIADVFVVQNEELLKVYPNSIFLGRL